MMMVVKHAARAAIQPLHGSLVAAGGNSGADACTPGPSGRAKVSCGRVSQCCLRNGSRRTPTRTQVIRSMDASFVAREYSKKEKVDAERTLWRMPEHRSSYQRFPKLQADEFRHPLDRQNTALLQMIPGLNEAGKFLLGSVAEQILLLENIGTSILVGKNQLPNLYRLMQEAAEILDVEPPDLYVRQNPSPNAYTLAMSGRKPFVVVHSSLLELLTPAEVQAVLAHELGHLKCDHGIWLTFANIIALGAGTLPGLGALIARNLEEQLMRWLRAAELTCDRAALLVAQDPKVVVSVLMKLAGGAPSLAAELNVDAFLQQARSYEEAASTGLGWYLRNAQTRQLSHPLPVMRAREIDEWARGREYKNLLARAKLVEQSVV